MFHKTNLDRLIFLTFSLTVLLLVPFMKTTSPVVEEEPQEIEPVEEEVVETTQDYDVEATEPEFNWDFPYVMRVVGAECRGEPVEGVIAVCQCIKNTSTSRCMTPEEVVKTPGQYTDPLPTEFYNGGEIINECMLLVWCCDEKVTDEPIKYFCTPDHNSGHRQNYQYVMTIGNHEFYK